MQLPQGMFSNNHCDWKVMVELTISVEQVSKAEKFLPDAISDTSLNFCRENPPKLEADIRGRFHSRHDRCRSDWRQQIEKPMWALLWSKDAGYGPLEQPSGGVPVQLRPRPSESPKLAL